jgi:hypothetical protein
MGQELMVFEQAPDPVVNVCIYTAHCLFDRFVLDWVVDVALCRELQQIAGRDWFFLDCRTAGRLIGVDHTAAWRYVDVLYADGFLQLGEKGTFGNGKATGKASAFQFVELGQSGEVP